VKAVQFVSIFIITYFQKYVSNFRLLLAENFGKIWRPKTAPSRRSGTGRPAEGGTGKI